MQGHRQLGTLLVISALLLTTAQPLQGCVYAPHTPTSRYLHVPYRPAGTLVSRRDEYDATAEPLLVSLLDGKLVALDRQSGQQLWTLRTGPSLVSTWTTPMGDQAQQCASDLQHATGSTCEDHHDSLHGIQVFPGLDGSLFMAHTADGSLENVQVHLSMPHPAHHHHRCWLQTCTHTHMTFDPL